MPEQETEETADLAAAEEEVLTVEEEFQLLNTDVEKLTAKWAKLAQSKRESLPEVAAVYSNIAGDLLPLLQDLVKGTGSAFSDTFVALDELDPNQDQVGLSEEEAKQIVIAQLMNIHAFEQMLQGAPAESQNQIKQYLGVNQEAMKLMGDVYGEELIAEATSALSSVASEVEAASEG